VVKHMLRFDEVALCNCAGCNRPVHGEQQFQEQAHLFRTPDGKRALFVNKDGKVAVLPHPVEKRSTDGRPLCVECAKRKPGVYVRPAPRRVVLPDSDVKEPNPHRRLGVSCDHVDDGGWASACDRSHFRWERQNAREMAVRFLEDSLE